MFEKACFFDRDGCLIVEKDYLSEPSGVELLPGAVDAIRLMRDNGYKIIVVSNQSGIARGYFTIEQLKQVEKRVSELFAKEGVAIDANYYCYHHVKGSIPEYSIECDCRKPKPGMLLQAAKEWNLDLSKCLMVGDKSSDVEAGLNASCRFAALVRTGHGAEQQLPDAENVLEADDILSACQKLLQKCSADDLARVDKAMAVQKKSVEGIQWYEPAEKPLLLAGFNWYAVDKVFNRLPLDRPREVTQYPDGQATMIFQDKCGAYQLSDCNAGGRIYFRTNSRRVYLKYFLNHCSSMDHMAYTGSAGFDLYCRRAEDASWRLCGVTRIGYDKQSIDSLALNGELSGEMCDCVIHFPLYNGVKYVSVGVEQGAIVEEFHPWRDERKIVLYGTSISQGGCASRPGMAASNILARDLAMDVLNFGFSGSGKGEPEIARMLLEVPNPALFLLDYDWNIHSAAEMTVSLTGFIDILREKYPLIPIVVISRTPSARDATAPDSQESIRGIEKKQAQMDEVARRQKSGDKHIFFVDGSKLLGEDYWECLVDGCHMTDLGFYRWAKNIEPFLNKLL